MKKNFFTHRRIRRDLQAASLALMLSLPAHSTPIYTEHNYKLTGTTVSGSGTSSAAYFNDIAQTGYSVQVEPGANLSDPYYDEIEIDRGRVVNEGTLSYGGADANSGTVVINQFGEVDNSGLISAPNDTAIQFFGPKGAVFNTGTISSEDGISFAGRSEVVNSGKIIAVNAGCIYGSDTGDITNSGTMSGGEFGVSVGSLDRTSTVTNTGTISASYDSAAGIYVVGKYLVMNKGNLQASYGVDVEGKGTVTNSAEGSITATYSGLEVRSGDAINHGKISCIGIGPTQAVYVGHGSMINSGSIIVKDEPNQIASGIFSYGGPVENSGSIEVENCFYASGIELQGYGTITNSGTITATSSNAHFNFNGGDAVGIFSGFTGTVTNSGQITAEQYGIFAQDDHSKVISTGGTITGNVAAILLMGRASSVTLQGTAVTVGTIDGGRVSSGNTLNFELSGLGPVQAANFAAYIETHGRAGTYSLTRNGKSATYNWTHFASVTDNSK